MDMVLMYKIINFVLFIYFMNEVAMDSWI
jgi:hypothetical protein